MHNYAGSSAAFPPNVRIVDDSDAPNAANLMAGVTDLADRTAYLNANAIVAAGGEITGLLQIDSGGVLDVDSGGSLFVLSGGLLEIAPGGLLRVSPGGAIQLQGAGGLLAANAGAVQATAVAGIKSMVAGGIQLAGGSNDQVTFSAARLRQIVRPLEPNWSAVGQGGVDGTNWDMVSGLGARSLGTSGAVLNCPLREVHDGAPLTIVEVYFRVMGSHMSGLPTMPSFEIFRVPFTLGAGDPYGAAQSLTGGPVSFPTPGSVGAYEASNHLQAFAVTCSANNVINKAGYFYFLQLHDEQGAPAVAGNVYWGTQLNFTVPDMRFP